MTPIRRLGSACVIACSVTAPLAAQCPDGTPPPCRGARRASPRADSSTALVVPLTPVGGDTALRRLGANFAAIVAENITAGDVHGIEAGALAALPAEARTRAAMRQGAGGLIDGSMVSIGSRVRASVRLVETGSARVITTTTVEGSRDSLLTMADAASLALLKAWWGTQKGPRLRSGAVTSSLPAMRHYVNAMVEWGREGRWRVLLDSAVRYDPAFLAAWEWLAIPAVDKRTFDFGGFAGLVRGTFAIMTPDSAARALVAVAERQEQWARPETARLPFASSVALLALASIPPPMPGFERGVYCTGGVARTTEAAYVDAVRVRLATLAGCPDSLALAAARNAAAVDSTFAPTSRLLIVELIDVGDTAAARRLLDRRHGTDSEWEHEQRTSLSLRLATTTDATVDTSDAIMGLLGWHRFRALLDALPSLKRSLAAQSNQPSAAATAPMLDMVLQVPVDIATGHRDSAAALLRASISGIMGSVVGSAAAGSGPQAWLQRASLSGLTPDTLFYPPPLDTAQVLGFMQRMGALTRQAAGSRRDIMALQRRMMAGSFSRIAWLHGLFALEKGDRASSRRFAELLDSLVEGDSVGPRALALGLRGEIALASDSADKAVQLMSQAIGVSATTAPERYRWLLAKQYAATEHPDLALRLARSITMPSSMHGSDNAYYYAAALKLEGELLERLGRRAEAVSRYQDYVELRRDADAAFQPEVAQARAALARLRAAP